MPIKDNRSDQRHIVVANVVAVPPGVVNFSTTFDTVEYDNGLTVTSMAVEGGGGFTFVVSAIEDSATGSGFTSISSNQIIGDITDLNRTAQEDLTPLTNIGLIGVKRNVKISGTLTPAGNTVRVMLYITAALELVPTT